VIKCENINTKRTKQGYGTKLYFKLMFNRLKIEGVLLVFIPFWDFVHRSFHECFYVPTNQRTFLRAFVIVNEL
jgi:hypothetical protein